MSDSDLSESEADSNLYKYTLVRFVHRGRKRQIESIDVVPSKWLHFDNKKGKCVTKFMEGPYNAEDFDLIHQLTINEAAAPEDWPTFTVELKGRARTYAEALKKLNRLEVEDHVLSLESGESASEVRKEMTKSIKRQKLLDDSIKMKNILSLVNKDEETTGQNGKVGSPLPKDSTTNFSGELINTTQSKQTSFIEDISNVQGTSADSEEFKNSFKSSTSTASTSTLTSFPVSDIEESFESSNLKASVENHNVLTEQLVVAPIINLESIECKSDFETAVVSHLINLTNVVYAVKQQQDEMTHYLIDKKVVTKCKSNLEKKYNLVLPINSLQVFNELDDKLKTDNFLKNDVYIKLCSLMDKDNVISRSYVNMLKAFISKDVAIQFTSVRISTTNKNKIKFKPTELSKLIDVSITKSRSKQGLKTAPEDLTTALSNVLGNVNKWKQ